MWAEGIGLGPRLDEALTVATPLMRRRFRGRMEDDVVASEEATAADEDAKELEDRVGVVDMLGSRREVAGRKGERE